MNTKRSLTLLATTALLLACRTDSDGTAGNGLDGGGVAADGAAPSSGGQAGAAPSGGGAGGTTPGPVGNEADASVVTPGVDASASKDAATVVDAKPPVDTRQPEPAQVTACHIVSCASGDCCTNWYAFSTSATGQAHPAGSDRVETFTPTRDSVSASFDFKAAGETGAVGFALAMPRAVTSLRVTMQQTGVVMLRFATLEADTGRAGCAYTLSAEGVANLAVPRYCWGGTFTPDGVSIRLEAKSAGAATLKVTAVRLD